jgi:hypothetical protein
MKTSREILLERHRATTSKLDAIRRAVVTEELNNQGAKAQSVLAFFVSSCLRCSNLFWQELILPSCRMWAGLAVTWILIFVFNLSQRDPAELVARKSPAPAPEMILTFRQQERLLSELTGPNEPQAVSPSKPFLPEPRSEGRIEILMT